MTPTLTLTACVVDLAAAEVRWPGRVDRLTATEARLLRYLAERPDAAVAKADLLREVWGYRPGIASRAVDTTVQRLRLKVEVDPEEPRHLLTVYGIGYRLRPGPEAPQDGFVGRTAELDQLCSWLLAGPGLLTLVGPGGSGKSRLARRALQQVQGGGLIVSLDGVGTATDVLHRVAATLGAPLHPDPHEPPASQLARVLSARGAPILLDDVETAGPALRELLPAWCACVPVLATGPVALQVPGEVVLPLPPLAPAESVRLLVERARTVGAELQPSDPTVLALGHCLEGSPLAIELAAARLVVLSPAELVERLARPLGVLASSAQPPRHRSLRAALDGGWTALGEHERALLRSLSVLPGPFGAGEAEALSGLGEDDALSALGSLVRTAWVQRDPPGFVLLASIRTYAREQADALGERPALEARLRAWAVDRAERLAVAIDGPQAQVAAAATARDWPGLAAAVESSPGSPEAARIGVGLLRFAYWSRRFREGVELLRGDPWPGAPRALVARAYAARARLRLTLGLDTGPDLAQAYALVRGADPGIEALCHVVAGTAAVRAGRYPEAEALLRDAAGLADAVGDARTAGAARLEASIVARARGDLADALRCLDEAQVILTRAEAARDLALLEGQRGIVLAALGRRMEAESASRRAIALLDRLGDEASGETVRGNLANLLLLDDRVEEAERLLRRALQSARHSGNRTAEAHYLMGLGGAATTRGQLDAGMDHFVTARSLFQAGGAAFPSAVCRSLVARLLHARGALDEAERAYHDAVEELARLGRTRGAARVAALRAAASAARGGCPDPEAVLSGLGTDPALDIVRALLEDPQGKSSAGAAALRALADTRDRRLLPE